jgi:gamma-glutamyltranspeptidase/glutathione hydrolase
MPWIPLAMTTAPVDSMAFAAVRGDRSSGWLPQTRSEVLARHGMVTTSQPLASQAGLAILKNGGNAFDAAVATAAVLNVVEPHSAGIGGDAFVLAWSAKEKKLIALNGSGRAPSGAAPARLGARGYTAAMPQLGIDSATVPGAVDAWHTLLERAGTRSFNELLQPAVEIASEGFAISERIHNDWLNGAAVLKTDPDSAHTYLVNGSAPATYSVFRNPDLARAFRLLQDEGRDAFYEGEIAQAILAKSRALGGSFTAADLSGARANWVEPIHTHYHGRDVFELPPNTQGFAVLQMLNILEACEAKLGVSLAALGPRSPLYWHLLVEAKKLAYADLYAHNADPQFTTIPLERLISKTHAAEQCAKLDMNRASVPPSSGDPVGGTVYVATADRWGNMVSFIYSTYGSFGAGVTVPGFGFVLNNRAALFSLNARSPNIVAPGKRPFHTLLPGFVMQNGQPLMAFGLMGGAQQAQGHVQVLIDLLDLGANLQAASDAARFTHAQSTNTLEFESNLYDLMGGPLRELGHTVVSANGQSMGGYQAIARIDGTYRGASDHRKDGQAVGW